MKQIKRISIGLVVLFLLMGFCVLPAIGTQIQKKEKPMLITTNNILNDGQQITYCPDRDMTLHYNDEGLSPEFDFWLTAYDLDISNQNPSDKSITIRGKIVFGDGSETEWSGWKEAHMSDPLKVSASHTYAKSETSYNVKFKTEDQTGQSTTKTVTLTIQKSKNKNKELALNPFFEVLKSLPMFQKLFTLLNPALLN